MKFDVNLDLMRAFCNRINVCVCEVYILTWVSPGIVEGDRCKHLPFQFRKKYGYIKSEYVATKSVECEVITLYSCFNIFLKSDNLALGHVLDYD